MSLKAYFNSDRLIFENLRNLPGSKSLWIPYSSEEESEKDTIDITDVKTGACFRVTLSEHCSFFRLCVGPYVTQKWQEKLPVITSKFHTLSTNLQKVIDRFKKDSRDLRIKVSQSEIAQAAGGISQMMVFCPQNTYQKSLGLYFLPTNGSGVDRAFLNVKGANILGKGGYRIYKLCYDVLNGHLYAKGIKKNPNTIDMNRELEVLLALRNKTGIIRTHNYCLLNNIKYLLFQDFYSMNLFNALENPKFPLTDHNKFAITQQLLMGLAEIAKLGVHYDLQLQNFLVRFVGERVECVITDFQHFYPHKETTYIDFSDVDLVAPEWARKEQLSQEYDVWKMGLSIYELFKGKEPPEIKLRGQELCQFLLSLKTGWLDVTNMPPKIGELVTKMTEPDRTKRMTAVQALEYFNSQPANLQ